MAALACADRLNRGLCEPGINKFINIRDGTRECSLLFVKLRLFFEIADIDAAIEIGVLRYGFAPDLRVFERGMLRQDCDHGVAVFTKKKGVVIGADALQKS